MSTVAERLASFSSALTADQIPAEVREAARLHLLDTLGCGLAAHALDIAPAARRAMTEDGASGPATVIGHEGGLPPADAALANGSTFHALDFDDTHSAAVAHVSAAVVPAVLASAEAARASGSDVVTALVAGNEIVIRLGTAAGSAFHARGFHPTAVCGIFGATAAAARLRGLDAATTVQALGIAGSMASGVLEFLADGSSTKRLHPGWVAHAGIIATRLAAHGATGPSTIIEGRFGLYRAYLGREDVDIASQVADLGERWETPRIAYKPYPACHYMHASVSATAQILEEHSLRVEDIESIVALAGEAGVRMVLEPLADKHRPRTEYDAKFSLPYSVASLIVRGVVDVTTYTDAALRDEEVLALAGKVTYEVKEYATAADAFPGGIRILTRDGRTLEADLEYQRGAPENPMSAEDVVEKFRSNAALALPAEDTLTLEESVMGLEDHADLGALRVLGRAAVKEEVAA